MSDLDELTEKMQGLCERAKHPWPQTNMFNHKFVEMARTYIPLVIEERERLHSALLACAKFLPLTTNAPDHHHVAGTGVPGLTEAMLLELHKQIDAAMQKEPKVNGPNS